MLREAMRPATDETMCLAPGLPGAGAAAKGIAAPGMQQEGARHPAKKTE